MWRILIKLILLYKDNTQQQSGIKNITYWCQIWDDNIDSKVGIKNIIDLWCLIVKVINRRYKIPTAGPSIAWNKVLVMATI